ncbi:MAG: serine hydrolase [Candidatus Eremiobacteraeota bacterium]|nr:serine hydrolase [Candidatus Eremiobacteraeota bacterium]
MRPFLWLGWGGLLLLVGCGWTKPDATASPSHLRSIGVIATPTAPASPSPEDPRSQKLEAVREVLDKAAQDFPGKAALVFYDLELGQTIAVHGDEQFEAASLIKIPILVELYRQIETGELSIDEEMVYEERFRVEGSGLLKDEEAGGKYKLTELARLMVQESDNVATDMLIERLGMDKINQEMGLLGLTHTVLARRIYDFKEIDRGHDNLTTANDVALLFRELGEGRLPGSTAMHQILEGQKRNDMLPAKLPKGTRVAHKTGELLRVLHDAGLIYTDHGSYVLVLLGQGFEHPDEVQKFWADVSAEVHEAYMAGRSTQ